MTFEQFVMILLTMVTCFSIGYDLCKLKYKKLLREKDELIEAHKNLCNEMDKKNKAQEALLRARDSVIHSQEEVINDYRNREMELKAELAKVNDPETQRVLKIRRQMQQDQAAFNLLFNYGPELAYGQVSAGDVMGVKEGRVE